MKTNNSKIILGVGIGGIALIALVGLAKYNAVFFFNGYEYTAIFSAIALLLTAVGLFMTLFKNNPHRKGVGIKIELLAKALAGLFIIAGLLTWMIGIEDSLLAWSALSCGLIMALFTLPLYGFGQMVDDVSAMRKGAEKPMDVTPSKEPPKRQ